MDEVDGATAAPELKNQRVSAPGVSIGPAFRRVRVSSAFGAGAVTLEMPTVFAAGLTAGAFIEQLELIYGSPEHLQQPPSCFATHGGSLQLREVHSSFGPEDERHDLRYLFANVPPWFRVVFVGDRVLDHGDDLQEVFGVSVDSTADDEAPSCKIGQIDARKRVGRSPSEAAIQLVFSRADRDLSLAESHASTVVVKGRRQGGFMMGEPRPCVMAKTLEPDMAKTEDMAETRERPVLCAACQRELIYGFQNAYWDDPGDWSHACLLPAREDDDGNLLPPPPEDLARAITMVEMSLNFEAFDLIRYLVTLHGFPLTRREALVLAKHASASDEAKNCLALMLCRERNPNRAHPENVVGFSVGMVLFSLLLAEEAETVSNDVLAVFLKNCDDGELLGLRYKLTNDAEGTSLELVYSETKPEDDGAEAKQGPRKPGGAAEADAMPVDVRPHAAPQESSEEVEEQDQEGVGGGLVRGQIAAEKVEPRNAVGQQAGDVMTEESGGNGGRAEEGMNKDNEKTEVQAEREDVGQGRGEEQVGGSTPARLLEAQVVVGAVEQDEQNQEEQDEGPPNADDAPLVTELDIFMVATIYWQAFFGSHAIREALPGRMSCLLDSSKFAFEGDDTWEEKLRRRQE